MKKYLIANWKMKLNHSETVKLAKQITKIKTTKYQLVVAPSTPYLFEVGKILVKSNIKLSAQNLAAWSFGSYTGETSSSMIKEAGCQFSLIGHSERREHLNESAEMIGQKVQQAIDHNITPVLCVGETEAEKKVDQTKTVLVQQIRKSLSSVKNLTQKKIVIAYEPVWAVGTGQVVDAESLEKAYLVIKHAVSMLTSARYFDQNVSFLYGGSLNSKNIELFVEIPYLQGFLVGGAGLDVNELKQIVEA
ncbi:triose-phosphate isomerase [Candidatus Falkowbacteria bacterium CG10_big_fil_rev_8_21_14_0_10_39_11]|uniref:Triosephosphate isomerase n=1 Tax=Candidatus Falkowbacteria bacterium CG10_big_fil_rev_8_21_14_0_10_39_11 TaxID=1974565 RepID=A0A2H0V3W3_9BACT|nr:MAG: triose-phosphate isomerase [Candidatus Falkowbacteria bacterium CG10_big_fil_rev_8_21_14_0_10_39_11]